MTTRRTCGAIAAMLVASSAFADVAFADTMTMWVRASGANAAAHLVDLWNATHADKIELTTIPDNQMVTKLATGVQAGEVPDLVSFDLIYMPDFMKAGFLTALTADLKPNPNLTSVAPAYKGIATYEGKIYSAGFTPDVSILIGTRICSRRRAWIRTSRAPFSSLYPSAAALFSWRRSSARSVRCWHSISSTSDASRAALRPGSMQVWVAELEG